MTSFFPSFPTAEMQPAPRPPQLSLFIPPSGPPFQALCVALGHHPDPLRVSWVLRGQLQEEDFTGGAGAPTVSWLQLPQEVAGMSVTCQGLHQRGVSDVVLPLPWGQGEYRGPDASVTPGTWQAQGGAARVAKRPGPASACGKVCTWALQAVQ